jgi:hypothetical protein
MCHYFDYERVAAELRVAPDELAELEREVRDQYPHDQMLFELRMLRTLDAVAEGDLTVAEAVAEFRAENVRMASAG